MPTFPIEDAGPRLLRRCWQKVKRGYQLVDALLDIIVGTLLAAGGGVLLSEGTIGRLCRRGWAPEITVALVLLVGGVLWAVHGYRRVCRWRREAGR